MLRILVLSVLLARLATPARAADRNVVFFVADDHGAEALGAYGNRVVKTPGLDTFASEGVRFTHAFATTASCSASRSVLLTRVHNHRNGQYGHEHEYHHFSAFPNVRSLPVLLAEAGYRTARGGKFHVAPENVFRFQQVITLPTLERDPLESANLAATRRLIGPEEERRVVDVPLTEASSVRAPKASAICERSVRCA